MRRAIGIALSLVGAVVVGVPWFGGGENGIVPNAPVVGGIITVVGLLLLAGDGRRD